MSGSLPMTSQQAYAERQAALLGPPSTWSFPWAIAPAGDTAAQFAAEFARKVAELREFAAEHGLGLVLTVNAGGHD